MPILHYMYYAKYGSGLLRVSMSYAYQGVNRKQVLHPRIPRRPRHTVSLQVPHAQTVATDSEDSMGCMTYRSRDRGRGSSARQCTIPVATRWHVLPIPVHVGDRQAPGIYRSRCNQGQKGSVMHRFRGYRGKLDAKKYQVPPRFPGLRGCTRPIVNSWVKFFPWGTGEGGPFWACRLSVVKQNRHGAGTWVGTWSWPLRGVRGFRGFNMMVMTSGLFQPRLVCTPSPPSQAKSTRGHSTGDVSTQKAGIPFGWAVIADQRLWRVLG